MAISQTPVTGPIVAPDGSVAAHGQVSLHLSAPDREDDTLISPVGIRHVLDGAGSFDAELWPNAAGARGDTYYRMQVSWWDDATRARRSFERRLVVPLAGGAPYSVAELYVDDVVETAASPVYIARPESYSLVGNGDFDDTAHLNQMFAASVVIKPRRDHTYRVTRALTIPAGAVIDGELRIVYDGDDDLDWLTIGNDVLIDRLRIEVPTATGVTATIGTGYRGGEVYLVGAGNQGAAALVIADTAGLDLDRFESAGGFQRPLVLGNNLAWSTGGRLGDLRVRDFVRGVGLNYLDGFTLGAYDIGVRNVLASYTPGHNGILASGIRNCTFGAGRIEGAGEHLWRVAGDAAMGSSYNSTFGDMKLDGPGGSFIKINADARAYGFRFGDVDAVGRFSTPPGGNREVRLSHADGISFGRLSLRPGDGYTYSSQDALALNDVSNISVAHLHADGLGQSVIDCVSGQDTGSGLGDGHVRGVHIGGLTGTDANSKVIVKFQMASGYEVSDITIAGMDYASDGPLVTASGTTVVSDVCSISGRLRRSDPLTLPTTNNLPADMAIDVMMGQRRVVNRGGVLAWGDAITPGLFGAVGDAVDSADAINAASAYLDGIGGGELHFSNAAVYQIGQTLDIYPGVILRGHGATLRRAVSATEFDMTGLVREGDRVEISDLTFDGNRQNQVSGDMDGVLLRLESGSTSGAGTDPNSNDLVLSNVRFVNGLHGSASGGTSGSMCSVSGFARARLTEIYAEDGGKDLLHAVYMIRCSDVRVNGYTAYNLLGDALKVQGKDDKDACVLSNILVDGCQRGIFVTDMSDVSISATVIKNVTETSGYGLAVTQTEDTGRETNIRIADDVIVRDCVGYAGYFDSLRNFYIGGQYNNGALGGVRLSDCDQGVIAAQVKYDDAALTGDIAAISVATGGGALTKITISPTCQLISTISATANVTAIDLSGLVAGSEVIIHADFDAASGFDDWFASGFDTDLADTNGVAICRTYTATFTPVLTTTGTGFTSVTYDSLTAGSYTVSDFGKMLDVRYAVRTDAVTVGAASSGVVLTGCPVTMALRTPAAIYTGDWTTNPVQAYIDAGASALTLRTATAAVGVSAVATGANANYLIAAVRGAAA